VTRTRDAAFRAARIWMPALCAALAVLPGAARAQSVRSSAPAAFGEVPPPLQAAGTDGPGATSITVAAGPLALFGGESALALQIDYGYVHSQSGKFAIEWHFPLAVSLPKTTEDITRRRQASPLAPPVDVVTGTKKDDLAIAQLVPSGRLVYAVGPGIALHVDGGIGIAEVVEKIDEEEQSIGHTETTKYTTAPVVRLGAGIVWEASRNFRFSLEPAVLSWQLGYDRSSFSAFFGIAYRL
jgi:hypothetical protein